MFSLSLEILIRLHRVKTSCRWNNNLVSIYQYPDVTFSISLFLFCPHRHVKTYVVSMTVENDNPTPLPRDLWPWKPSGTRDIEMFIRLDWLIVQFFLQVSNRCIRCSNLQSFGSDFKRIRCLKYILKGEPLIKWNGPVLRRI